MAIGLASAIGQQREPIGILGGLDDAINKTGDAIQADQLRSAAEAKRKAEQDQQYKDLVAATLKTRSLEGVRTEDWEEDQKFQKEGFADILLSSKDQNVTKAQLEQKLRDYTEGLQKREHLYKRDYDTISSVAKKQDTHDTSLFDNFLIGRTNPTQVANMPNDDFMAASEADRAGKMVGENGMQATETEIAYQDKPYFNQSIDERLKTDIKAKESELTALKRPNIVKAAQGYLGSDFKFGSLTKRTDKVSPTSGEYIYEFDEKGADELARKFASSVVGEGNFGSKEHSQYQRALEYEALRAGNEAGFSGDKLKEFVQEAVPRMAYDDFMKDARAAEAERSKNEKDITKQPSKGGSFIQNFGGGSYKTNTGNYEFIDNQLNTADKQRFTNFKNRQKENFIRAYDKKFGKGGAEFYGSAKGEKFMLDRFHEYHPESERVIRVAFSQDPEKKNANPEQQVINSKGEAVTFIPKAYDIDARTNKIKNVYGVEVTETRSGDNGEVVTKVQKESSVPYNVNNKNLTAIATDMAKLYKDKYGRDLDLSVDEEAPTKSTPKKSETAEERRARLKKELIK